MIERIEIQQNSIASSVADIRLETSNRYMTKAEGAALENRVDKKLDRIDKNVSAIHTHLLGRPRR